MPLSSSSSEASNVCWQHAQQGRLKCNIDASFSQEWNGTGIGICVRDDDGATVLAKSMSFSPLCHVFVGEALGLFYALDWLSDIQMDNVDFVVDSKTTSDAFHSNRSDVSEFGHIITVQKLFTFQFTNSRVEFNRRQANEVAHALAREAVLSPSPTIYFNIPQSMNNIIINKML